MAVPAPAPAAACCEIRSLVDVLNAIPDPRNPKGVRYPLGSLLSLCVVALLCGAQNPQSISRFALNHPQLLSALGFHPPRIGRVAARRGHLTVPSNDMIARALDMARESDFNALIGQWLGRALASRETACLDGKALRGQDDYVVSLYCPTLGHVLWQTAVGDKQSELSALLSALPEILARLGKVRLFTADAGFCHKEVARSLVAWHRHYLLQLKAPHQTDLAIARDSFRQLASTAPLARSEEKRGDHEGAKS